MTEAGLFSHENHARQWIAVKDMRPGDRIKVIKPPNVARVIKVGPDPRGKTMIRQNGRDDWEKGATVIGWIVDFEYLDGPLKGRRGYTWQHPEDRIYIG